MRLPLTACVLALAALGVGCKRPAAPAPVAPADPADAYNVATWPLPSTTGAAQPDLAVTADGRVLLSWISSIPGRRNALRFVAQGRNGHWQSAPRTIVVGNSLLASWADPPRIAATPDGALWVQWAQKVEGAAEASDIMLSRSRDGGFNWSPPVLVNTDGTQTEHGFVALWPQSRDRLGVAWLDGRAKADAGHQTADHANAGHGTEAMHADDQAHEHAAGEMMLRAAFFDPTLRRSHEAALDTRTCDCCITAAAVAAAGPLLAYRDRDADEIRDISVVRFVDDAWTAPVGVHADGWKMPGCPVNGPAAAAQAGRVVVAWYSAANGQDKVQVAASTDSGAHFAAPVVVDAGAAVQGRVAVAIGETQAWVLWLREDAQGQSLWLARYNANLTRQFEKRKLADLAGRGRGTGYPQLAIVGNTGYVVWTDVADGVPQLHGLVLTPKAD